MNFRQITWGLTIVLSFIHVVALAQKPRATGSSRLAPTPYSERMAGFFQRQQSEKESLARGINFRCVGPTVMSGRVVDLEVDPNDPTHFYVAYASGGLWETRNNGTSFEPLFDREAVLTIGDIAVDWYNGGTLWVGTGENNSSRSSYSGCGIYKSEDGGKRWIHMGLGESHHIGRVVLNPFDSNTMWVAVLGHLYSDNSERGVYKTTDGGKSWKLVLNPGTKAGAIDLVMDPINPQVLYAATWERSRTAWNFEESGGSSLIYFSNDGGTAWSPLMNGFPTGKGTGRIGIAMHHSMKGKALYAILDNQNHRPEEPDAEPSKKLKSEVFEKMNAQQFAQLSDTELENFLRDNHFPKAATAQSVKADVASGKLKPSALYDYLYDANRNLFNTPVIGAQVYRYDFDNSSWKLTHEDYLDDLYYTYGYYFGLIRVSPVNPDKIYIAGVPLLTSDDGGRTFKSINPNNVHVDHHALWVNPDKAGHLINGSDGGVQISYDDGTTWINCNTPAVGQFYSVAVDDAVPYNVYGGLQDNGVWTGPSTNQPSRDWYATGRYPFEFLMGGDGMQVQVDTRDNKTIYTGYQFGWYSRLHRDAGHQKSIHPVHELGERPLRWNWQTPILLSKHHQDIFYIGSNKVHRSLDKGDHFNTLSADLTRGGRAGDVPYGTLTSISESPLRFGLLATGSDDGLVHISKDNGYTWEPCTALNNESTDTPSGMSLWVSRVVWSSHRTERIYVSLNGYRLDHFKPYIYVSDDQGKTWKSIAGNLPCEPVNVIREDPRDENILYAGTDHGAYFTLDRGNTWMRLACNMPHAPVHDMVIQPRELDLVLGTHGRSIWIGSIAHLAALNQVKDSVVYLFDVPPLEYSTQWGNNWSKWMEPEVPEVNWQLYLKEPSANLEIKVIFNDSLVLYTQNPVSLYKGINTIQYDLSIDEAMASTLEVAMNKERGEGESPVELKKAGNGKYYLPKGKYTIEARINGTTSRRELVIE